MESYPLKFRPIYKQRIWGGHKLRDFFCKDIPEGEKIGESWELADLPNGKSVIANGQFVNQTLASVIEKYPKEITGDENFSSPFPLLIKFLDAEDILSVQVHPDEQTCKRMAKGEPKTECWYIIFAEPNAVIYKGLKKGVSKQDFAEAIKKGNVAEMLVKVPVKAGQCHFLPAGTAHSIGAGLLIAEIQTPSDTTYRVFDWNRVDDSGKPRELHIEEALESIHFGQSEQQLSVRTEHRLADCKFFKIDKHEYTKNQKTKVTSGAMKVLVIIKGGGKITSSQAPLEIRSGDTILLPALFEGVMHFAEDTDYLEIRLV